MPLKIKKTKGFPRPPKTAMEVYEMLPEGTHVEVIDGVMYFLPDRTVEHQDCLSEILYKMRLFADEHQLGKAVSCPLGIYFDDNNVAQPDGIFISNGTMGIVKNGLVKGTPDLLMEILGDENRQHDLVRKLELYERFGVKEYFIIDPHTKEALHYILQDKKYLLQPATKGRIHSKILGTSFSF